MCLLTDNTKPQIAKKNIICYKLFKIVNINNKEYLVTPFQKVVMGFNKYKAAGNSLKYDKVIIFDQPVYVFGEGYFHAYRNKNVAIYSSSLKEYVYKCIIPKGSTFYIGKEGDICSNRIIIINPNENKIKRFFKLLFSKYKYI